MTVNDSKSPEPLTRSEFVELLHRAIFLYVDCEDYPEDAKLTDLRVGELALFIPTELPMERLGIPWRHDADGD